MERHVMIDLETLGTGPDAAIIAIGAVLFEPSTGKIKSEFYYAVDWDQGRTIDPETVKWWMLQSKEARDGVARNSGWPLHHVLKCLRLWLQDFEDLSVDYDVLVWGNGATFDISILEDAYGKDNIPWHFCGIRDMRTIKALAKDYVEKPEFKGTAHNALDDAIWQAQYVSVLYQAIKKGLTCTQ